MRVFGASAALCATVATAASADPMTFSIAGENYDDFGSGSLSISGKFNYDSGTGAVSGVNFSFILGGVTTNITKAAPTTTDGYIVLANEVVADQPAIFILVSNLISNPSAVFTFVGLCGPLQAGPTCNTSRYSPKSVSFLAGPTNTLPLSDAGPDQTGASGASVLLDGTASSDAESGPLTYSWTQISGPSVTLSNLTAAQPSFTAPTLAVGDQNETLVFSLTVNDGTDVSAADSVTIIVEAPTAVPPDAPTNLVAKVSDAQVSVAFATPSNTGGSAIIDYEYQLNGGSWISAATTASPIVITGLTNGNSYTIALRAVNAAGSGESSSTLSVNMSSPQSAFDDAAAAVRDIIVDEAVRSLQSTIAANQRMNRDARERFIAEQGTEDTTAELGNVPFDVDGGLDVKGTTLSSNGTFFGAQSLGHGTKRLMFGDFDLRHDSETGSSTATLTGRVAWEQMVSDHTLLGYFVGGELAYSNIEGAFSGDQNRLGLTVGGYAVHELSKNTYLDGFLTFGAGRNNLEMADAVLALESDYNTRSVTFGGALSSVIEKSGYEIWPELSFSYGRTWIGDVGFTGTAYGLVDNKLSLDAGSVTLANIMFRPEFRVPMDGLSGADSLQLFTFAPRFICEQVKAIDTEENCGGGAEIGFIGRSDDGMSNYSAKVIVDHLGGLTSSALKLNLEHKF